MASPHSARQFSLEGIETSAHSLSDDQDPSLPLLLSSTAVNSGHRPIGSSLPRSLVLNDEPDVSSTTPSELSCRDSTYFRRLFACVCMCLVVASVVSQSELTQVFFSRTSFSHIYFLTWWSYSTLVICFPLYLFFVFSSVFLCRFCRRNSASSSPPFSFPWSTMTWKKFGWLCFGALLLAPLQFLSAYFWLFSLPFFPVSVNNALGQSENVVVLFLSVVFCLRTERRNIIIKSALVLLGVVGFAVLGYSAGSTSSKEFPRAWIGVLFDVIQLLFEAAYQIVLTKWFDEDLEPFRCYLLMSLCGLVDFAFMWLGLFLLDWIDVESLSSLTTDLGSPFSTLAFLFFTSVCSVAYEVFSALAIAISNSPVYVSMSRSSVILFTLLIDVLFRGIVVSSVDWIAMVLVTLVILALNFVTVRKDNMQSETWIREKIRCCCCFYCRSREQ